MMRLEELAKTKRLDAFILTSDTSLKAYSGYWYNFETGKSPFHVIPAALLIIPGRSMLLILADDQQGNTWVIHDGLEIDYYSSYSYETPLDFQNSFCQKINDSLRQARGLRRIGMEKTSLPAAIYEFLKNQFPFYQWIDCGPDLEMMRAIKDEDEIELIREAAAFADIGQQAAVENAVFGISELELFALVRKHMESNAACRIPLMADLLSDVRTSTGGGPPTEKILEPNDIILCDLTPCLNGYWGDSCNTFHLGEPDTEQWKAYRLVKEALEIGIESLKPGITAMEVDRRMRDHLSPYGGFPHHGGHGVGSQYHEHPRITPYNDMILETGMVIALEPAVYTKRFGIRLEHLAVVRSSGPQLLTMFDHQFCKA